MAATNFDFPSQFRGDTCDGFNCTLTDADSQLPIDLTGALIRCQFRKDCRLGDVMLTAEVGDGIVVTDAAGGDFTLSPFVTNWPVGTTYYYDVDVTLASGYIVTPVYGTLPLVEDTTK